MVKKLIQSFRGLEKLMKNQLRLFEEIQLVIS